MQIVGYTDYTTRQGDVWDELALAAYDEERLSHILIEANPDYSGTLIFEAGVHLKIPILDAVERPETLPPWRRETEA